MVGSVLATPPDLFAMTVESTLTGTYREAALTKDEQRRLLEIMAKVQGIACEMARWPIHRPTDQLDEFGRSSRTM